ncbi:MAG: isoaspartyl peptidase/L-asparaginase [Thermoplasmatales archaeon]|jgi:L-asparaginase/beta-aspartyl-peptidase (threonine type)|nr:isoaspartyl peptidase/L-asparaginase [Candidatus Thermoplasmatota archaeon]MCL6002778.1 isoaspartyl peptidase/L-asparaginase [Candidatus Thermoplasmatota archaeon]MDA8056147.1 isoaspartyl peptidase/L-asparaginase [Thermoplasmatales archaeon]
MRQIIIHGGVGSSNELSGLLDKYASYSINYEDPLDAVVAAVKYMEDDLNFNAGTGSVMRLDGSIQMDASVMVEGNFGSVMNIEFVKNPVQVAREVMENSPHVILCSDGATKFAREKGHPYYDPTTDKARKRLKEAKEVAIRDPRFLYRGSVDTVGAVANYDGKIAAALSTGGSSPMMRGRVGDTPIPGSGILVKNGFGIAATGVGEEIIRRQLSYDLYCARNELEEEWKAMAGNSEFALGVVGFNGQKSFVLSNKSMARGYARADK